MLLSPKYIWRRCLEKRFSRIFYFFMKRCTGIKGRRDKGRENPLDYSGAAVSLHKLKATQTARYFHVKIILWTVIAILLPLDAKPPERDSGTGSQIWYWFQARIWNFPPPSILAP